MYFPIFLLLVFGLNGCSNDDDAPKDPISQLPPATQTGENTIGCLVNGEPLLPKGSLGQNRQCFYQLVDGEYYFGLSFSYDKQDIQKSLSIFFSKIQLSEQFYIIDKDVVNNPDFIGGAGYYYYTTNFFEGGDEYVTNNNITGEFKITKLDEENFIISGTFWFDAINDNGEIIHITEGRFDMQYAN